MKKNFSKLALILAITMFSTIVPVSAAELTGPPNEKGSKEQSAKLNSKAKILKEAVEKREESVKHFLKEDGTYQAVMYKTPVHYYKDGKWEDIDNSLNEKQDTEGINESKEELLRESTSFSIKEEINDQAILEMSQVSNPEASKNVDENIYENNNSEFNVKFAKNLNADKLVSIKKDGYEISWNIKADKEVIINSEKNSEKDLESLIKEINPENTEEIDKLKKTSLPNLSSSVEYKDVYGNIDINYTLISNKLKENIILKAPQDNLKFTFNLNLKNLIPKLSKENEIIFYDIKDNKEVFRMEAPYMYDANGAESSNIKLELTEKGKGYILAITPEEGWVKANERKYPITIDPPIKSSLAQQDIKETFVAYGDLSDKSNNMFLRVGNSPGINTTRSFIRFVNLPKLSPGDMVINAVLWLAKESTESGTDGQVDVHKVTSDWNAYGLNWNNKPSYNYKIEDYQRTYAPDSSWYYWDITSAARDWYNGGNNYGLMLKRHDEASGHTTYWSSDVSDTYSYIRPVVEFFYVSNSGLENYWTYHSQSIGRAGTSYVNDYNGNLILAHEDIAMTGNRLPINIKHIYNSNDFESNIGYGKGWRLNLSQTINYHGKINDIDYYRYIDEDGTRHYFRWDAALGKYKEESGIDLTMTIGSTASEKYKIEDKDKNQLIFNDTGALVQIVDKNQNRITLTYSGGLLTTVKDPSQRAVTLEYTSGILTAIYDQGEKRLTYGYGGNNQLWNITYADNKKSTYNYDASGYMLGAANIDGYKISYGYMGNGSVYRVNRIWEVLTDGSYGADLSIAYGFNQSTFIDEVKKAKGNTNYKNVYQFNYSGNTISIKDEEDRAEYYKYIEDEKNSSNTNNKLSLKSKLQTTLSNYLLNHNFEANEYWTPQDWGGNTGTQGYTLEEKYLGSQSIKINNTNNIGGRNYYQQFTVDKGKDYTFSSYVKISDIETNGPNTGAALIVAYVDKNYNWQVLQAKYISEVTDWRREEISFKVPSDAATSDVYAYLSLNASKGTVYYDNAQFEKAASANRYNLIENGDFNYGRFNYWNKNNQLESTDNLSSVSNSPLVLNNNTFKMVGQGNKQKAIYQTIKQGGKAGDTYIMSGWAKADSIPTKGGVNFGLSLGFKMANGDYEWYGGAYFNEDSNEWQYTSNVIVAKKDYVELVYYVMYYNNANDAYFDGFQLYKEEYGNSYTYDDKGNVVSTEDLSKQKSKAQYNSNNQIEKFIDLKGSVFGYTYDAKNNVDTATSAENVVYSFSYDEAGNPLTSKVGNATLFINSSATYTTTGNYIKTMTDASGNIVEYNYNEQKGTLGTVKDAKGSYTQYGYGTMKELLQVTKSTIIGLPAVQTAKNSYTYDKDKIATITHNTANEDVKYTFNYDAAGNNKEVLVGNKNLITNEFEPKTGKLLSSTYGNGQKVSSIYDALDRVTEKKYNEVTKFTYSYDSKGNINKHNDLVNGVEYSYKYDFLERVREIIDSKGNRTNYGYDINNNLNVLKQNLNNTNYVTRYSYDKDNRPLNTMYNRNNDELENSLLAYYTFDSNDASDSSGNDNTGVINGDAAFVASPKGKAIKLDGSGQWIELNNLNVPESFTISMLIKPEATTNQAFIGKNTNDGGNQFYFGYWNGGYDVTVKDLDYSGGAATINVYQHLVVVVRKIDTSKSEVKVFRDGTLLWKQEIGAVFNDTQGRKWLIGQEWDGATPSDLFKGEIDEISIFKGALTDATVPSLKDTPMMSVLNSYDALGRLEKKTIDTTKTTFDTTYQYTPGANGSTTTKVSEVKNGTETVKYTYDQNGNIKNVTTSINNNGTITNKAIGCQYNELNELMRENNQILNKTITYSYDIGGNILSRSEYNYTEGALGTATSTINYDYGDANWRDKLTSYNGDPIDYDDIGNPVKYKNDTYTWEFGRQLAGINGTGKAIAYKYNDSGIRTEKTVNGVLTKYYLQGDKVTLEESGSDKIYYTYDATGHLTSMNLNGAEYFYVRNAQGDVIGLIDSDGVRVVSYAYDSWGKLISIKDKDGKEVTTDTNHVGYKNPYRYRGYRYDTETGLYYLQSRYYNPEWGRFLNADGLVGEIGKLLTANMFAYTLNNPVNMKDPSGHFPIAAIIPVIAIVAVAVVTFIVIQNTVNLVADVVKQNYNMWKLMSQSNKISSEESSPSRGKEITEAGKPGTKSWNDAKKKIKEGKGKGVNVKVRNKEEAEKLINDAKPELERRPTYEADPPKAGYELHPVDNDYNMPHIKWRDWSNGKSNGADGHIFWDN